MNTWPGGQRHAMTPSQHREWNAHNYPGTLQLCILCDQPTERCEEDSFYADGADGPLCQRCYKAIKGEE